MKNRLIFIGSFYPETLKQELLSNNSKIDFAAHTFQIALLSGLDKYADVCVITSPLVRVNKSVRKEFIGYDFSHKGATEFCDRYVGTKNSFFLKFYELIRVRRTLKERLNSDPNAKVIVYSLKSTFLLALAFVGIPVKKSCVIIPDLPEYMSGNRSLLYRIAKRIDRTIINACLKKIDTFVLFSPYMASKLPLHKKPWIHIEGIYKKNVGFEFIKDEHKVLLYTGGISVRYGVFDLIEAFNRIPDSDYRLWLCGECGNLQMLNDYIKIDDRITYFGIVDKDKITELQTKATLLVNPRHSKDKFTRYSFPSKTLEYLASGTPTVMCKLPAMPDEYLPYLFIFEDETIEGYTRKIVEICSMPMEYLTEFGHRASAFILENKNEMIQAKKIINLLCE